MKLCHTCSKKDHFFTFSKLEDMPKDLKGCHFPIHRHPKTVKISHPPKSDIQITVLDSKLEKGTKIFYWAAKPKKLADAKKIENLKKSYCDKNRNFGCCKVKDDGKIVIKVMSPQCYKEDGKIWPKHIHFVCEKGDAWDMERVYTLIGIPTHSDELETKRLEYGGVYIKPETVKRTWKNGNYYMVYALSKKNPSLVDIEKYKGLKHLHIDHQAKSISIPAHIKKNVPMVVYCARESCNAAKKLMSRLADKGYENLFYMPVGMVDFSKESHNIFLNDKEENNKKSYRKMMTLYK